MKWFLLAVVLFALSGCINPDLPEFQNPSRRDWSKFEVPPAGTPVTLRVFNATGPREYEVVDLKGQWGDGEPFLISFKVTKRMDNVIRVEIHFRGEVLGAKNFNPPTIFEKDRTVGWRK
jgi:hypothetical protein